MDSVTPEETGEDRHAQRCRSGPRIMASSSSNNAADGTGAGARFLQANAAAQVAVNAEAALASARRCEHGHSDAISEQFR